MSDEGFTLKEFIITIEPMYIGLKKDKRLETVMTVKKLNLDRETYSDFQAMVPPKSRLDQEIKKILEAITKQQVKDLK